jgi:hypothetical protein
MFGREATCWSACGSHSGRFYRTTKRFEPRIAYHHPLWTRALGFRPGRFLHWTDDDLETLIDRYVIAARSRDCGYQFVDIRPATAI